MARLRLIPELAPLVLVVTADADIRRIVGSFVAQMELPAIFAPTWRFAVLASEEPPACTVLDLDGVGDTTVAVDVLQTIWDREVPFIVLSRRPDVAAQAAALGALAGIRKPPNVGALMRAIRRAVGQDRLGIKEGEDKP